jgi:hypothetical protein
LWGMFFTDLASSAMEYERHTDSYWDPFAAVYNVTADGLGGEV